MFKYLLISLFISCSFHIIQKSKALKPIVKKIPKLNKKDISETVEASLVPGKFLKIGNIINGGYYSYTGSFTTPGK